MVQAYLSVNTCLLSSDIRLHHLLQILTSSAFISQVQHVTTEKRAYSGRPVVASKLVIKTESEEYCYVFTY
jgi:hypothetical protein